MRITRTYLPASKRYTSFEIDFAGEFMVLLNTSMARALEIASQLKAESVTCIY